jgi:hypothetical protein
VLVCLFWCLWKEINNRCFEDLERLLEDILASFFRSFVLCIFGLWLVSPLSLSFVDFLVFFLFLVRCFLLYTSGVLRGALRF